ncbi:type II secretion system minor pseudopilin GspK [Ideonella sp. 4Y11]|uniref:Type II secretion system protein K n=1 Tax=Ideonella aquatica TaxID=2824119 RepID=A0A941BGP8_9BURK|nr:type II secretion system minor pseudopilin GspK [Ideonella aquatica]MBQ0960056.1 type II secretion system minor pseudopilin GspK [Ideonella aquatica]
MTRALLRSTQRGAALLLAMLIVTLVATLTAGMVWQQWQAIEVEGAERARSQASWLVQGAVDWARLILRTDLQDTKHRNIDSLDEVWATPLQDVRLSEFLAADRNNSADSSGLDAFLTGRITDAQSRYNLRNLVQDEKEDADLQLQLMQRLCDTLGLPREVATRIADGMNGASLAEDQIDDSERVAPGSPLTPMRMEQLAWLGLDSETIRRLEPFVAILPASSRINLNTAPPEVLMAAVEGLDRATAERLLRARLSGGFASLADAKKLLPERMQLSDKLLGVNSQYFEVLGELRYDSFVLRERSLVMRRGQDVVVMRRETLPPES